MFKRKKASQEDYDFGLDNSLYPADDELDPDGTQKKRHPGCFIAIVLVAVLIVGGLVFKAKRDKSTPVQPPTVPSSPAAQIEASQLFPWADAQGVYDEDGRLVEVVAPNGDPITDELLRQSFPSQLETGASLDAWESVATVIGELDTLDGAYLDANTGELILIGQPCDGDCSGLRLDDLLVAFQSVYADDPPGVSIDPGESTDQMAVRYIGPTSDTHFGQVMFEADRLMKTMSMGKDNVTDEPVVVTSVPGHKNLLEFGLALDPPTQSDTTESRHRFWIVVDHANLVTGMTGFVFQDFSFRINTEYLDANWQPLPPPVPVDPAAQAFADQLTQNYTAYATEFLAFDELDDVARMVSLAQWVRDSQLLTDNSPLLVAAPVGYVTNQATPAITTSLTVNEASGTTIHVLTETLWGGVNLSFKNTAVSTVSGLPELASVAAQARPASSERRWLFNLANRVYQAAAVPLKVAQTLGAYRTTPAAARLMSGTAIFEPIYDSMQSEAGELGLGWGTGLPRLVFSGDRADYPPYGLLYPGLRLTDPRMRKTLSFRGPKVIEGTNRIVYEREDNPNELIEVQPDGRFLWLNEAGEQLTFYADGRLLNITTLDGKITLDYNPDGTLRMVVTAAGETRRFDYGPTGLLTRVLEGQGNVLASFGYDAYNRLVEVRDGTKTSQVAYDSLSRQAAYWAGETLLFFDWQQGYPRVFRASAGTRRFVEAFGPSELERLASIAQLRQASDVLGTVVYLRFAGPRALLMIGEHTIEMPASVARDPTQLRAELEAHELLPPEGGLVFVADGDRAEIDFLDVFRGSRPFGSEGLDIELILGKAQAGVSQAYTPDQTRVFNGAPNASTNLDAMGLKGDDPAGWQEVYDATESAIQGAGQYISQPAIKGVPMSQQVANAFATYGNVIVIYAHGDEEQIYFPDGSTFTADQLDETVRAAIRRNQPTIVLIACKGARVSNTASLAKKFIDLGARLVIAPSVNIEAKLSVEFLGEFLKQASQTDILTALYWAWRKFPIPLFPFIALAGEVYQN